MALALADALQLQGEERSHFVDMSNTSPSEGSNVQGTETQGGFVGQSVPTWTPLLGREKDLAALRDKLSSHRLVTIHGPGGVGKSRLAAEIFHHQETPRRSWTEFTTGSSESSVEEVLARDLRVRDNPGTAQRQGILRKIGQEPWLIVLDNCEHRIEEVSRLLRDLLASCPRVTVLVTSRILTRINGEARWSLGGLTLPASDSNSFVGRVHGRGG